MHVSSKWLRLNYELEEPLAVSGQTADEVDAMLQPFFNKEDMLPSVPTAKLLGKKKLPPKAGNSTRSASGRNEGGAESILHRALSKEAEPVRSATEGLEGLALSSVVRLEETLSTRVIGQEEPIRIIAEHLQMA
jgi:hypothetical protein